MFLRRFTALLPVQSHAIFISCKSNVSSENEIEDKLKIILSQVEAPFHGAV
jgi:hypothetical protein